MIRTTRAILSTAPRGFGRPFAPDDKRDTNTNIDILNNLSNPNDLQDDIQLTKEVVGLHEICTKFRANYGG